MYRDPFLYEVPLTEPPPDPPIETAEPAVTADQWDAIHQVLEYSCSDSRFVEKAMKALKQILVFTPVAPV